MRNIRLYNAYVKTLMVNANHGLTPVCDRTKSLWCGKGFGNGNKQPKPVALFAAGLPTNCKCCHLQSTRCSCLKWTGCWVMTLLPAFWETNAFVNLMHLLTNTITLFWKTVVMTSVMYWSKELISIGCQNCWRLHAFILLLIVFTSSVILGETKIPYASD